MPLIDAMWLTEVEDEPDVVAVSVALTLLDRDCDPVTDPDPVTLAEGEPD